MLNQPSENAYAVPGKEKPINLDLVARVLATIASTACYIVLWIVGVGAGFVFSFLMGGAGAGVYFGWRKRKTQRYSELLLDISTPVLVGGLGNILIQLSIVSGSLDLLYLTLSMIVGALAFGFVRRHRFFFVWLAKPLVKIIAAPLVLMAMLSVGTVGLVGIASGLAVPMEAVTPSTIVDGWTADTPMSFFGRRVTYEKGGGGTAAIQIVAEPWTMTEEEELQDFDEFSQAILATIVVVGLETGQTTMVELGRSENKTPSGMYLLSRHYEINQSGETSFPRVELLIQSSQCDDSEVRVRAIAIIKKAPFEQLRSEALEMMESLQCEMKPE
jgi:hypothetical protein